MSTTNATAKLPRYPVLFISHGGPPLIMDTANPLHGFFKGLSGTLPRLPRAIVCLSAHWEGNSAVEVTSHPTPETIHDFYGFDDALYQLRYAARGDPNLASRIVSLLKSAGIEARENPSRGYDHGTWIPMMLAFPRADIPLLQISLLRSLDPERHLAIGRALVPLRADDVLIIGSGSMTHNLAEWSASQPQPHAVEFLRFVDTHLLERRATAREQPLVQFKSLQKDWRRVHPREEHFVPLFVSLGAADPQAVATKLTDSWMGALSCAAYRFDDEVNGS